MPSKALATSLMFYLFPEKSAFRDLTFTSTFSCSLVLHTNVNVLVPPFCNTPSSVVEHENIPQLIPSAW